MKKIFTILALAVVSLASCSKFDPDKTATENLSGNWVCTVYMAAGTEWTPVSGAEFMTYNTASNVGTEIWIDDYESFWGTKAKIDADNGGFSFGKEGKEYFDTYNGVGQLIWGGKITKDAAEAPVSGTKCDKIEFYIAFADDEAPYCFNYYVVGYRLTGFPEDSGEISLDWELPAVSEVPKVTEPLPSEGE